MQILKLGLQLSVIISKVNTLDIPHHVYDKNFYCAKIIIFITLNA